VYNLRSRIIIKPTVIILTISILLSLIVFTSSPTFAGSYDGEDLALAILQNSSLLIDSSYIDKDAYGTRLSGVFTSLGSLHPTHGDTFALFSSGYAGYVPCTTNEENPGDERGGWFGSKYSYPRDYSELTMTLQVPLLMHYLYYDVQFLSAEWPEYVGTQYNDKLTVTVTSPSKGTSQYLFDVNSGYFVLDANDITGTGFDIFAQSGNPGNVDIVDRTPRNPGADAGASDLIPIGGEFHPVSPGEQITVKIKITDIGDNLFDSAAFIDNLRFTGEAKTDITAKKYVTDLNGGEVESNDTLKYRIIISNTGTADQNNNPGNEFEDYIPENTTYVPGSASAEFGTISYDSNNNMIIWNGDIPGEISRKLEFKVTINESLPNGLVIPNQGSVFWDSDEDGTNDATELTDDLSVDDLIDQDGDGDTDDDDPTCVTVYYFDYPEFITEDFSDDTPGLNATQEYIGVTWFDTSLNDTVEGSFEVAQSYHYSTDQSFKTKIRQSDGLQYWNYSISSLEGNMSWWEIWFAGGDACEDYDLYIDLKNIYNEDIAKIRFDYENIGSEPNEWLLELFYWDPSNGWNQLKSDLPDGYLRNDWYKLKIEKDGDTNITYTLSRSGPGKVDNATCNHLAAEFSDLSNVIWYSYNNPTVCPMFFWDEHSIGLTYES
jgi:uncharacterized repeat protein (TIGR01451 family)